MITPDGVRRPVAVSIITFMLALTGKLMPKDRITRQGPEGWAKRNEHMGVGLVDRTLGQLGIGNIGAEVFRLAKPFGMKFIAHDPYADPKVAQELGVRLVGLEELFREADVLSVSCPLNDETHHIVNAERLALMKPGAYLINTSRGPVVDEKALTKVLQERRIARRRPRRLRAGAEPEGQPALQARQRAAHAARAVLDRPVLRRDRRRRRQGGVRRHARPRADRHRQPRDRRAPGLAGEAEALPGGVRGLTPGRRVEQASAAACAHDWQGRAPTASLAGT